MIQQHPHRSHIALLMIVTTLTCTLRHRLGTIKLIDVVTSLTTTTYNPNWKYIYQPHHHHYLYENRIVFPKTSTWIQQQQYGRRPRQYQYDDFNDDDENNHESNNMNGYAMERSRQVDRPTQTRPELISSPPIPSKPTIVVLGASGLLGRCVVRQLLETSTLDATIIAVVRDYDKACRVLYDDLIVVTSQKRGSKLIIVQGNLVLPEELPGYSQSPYIDNENIDDHNNNKISNNHKHTNVPINDFKNSQRYVQLNTKKGDDTSLAYMDANDDDVLQSVIRDCTTIISCIGTIRITNLWSDIVFRPLYRLLRYDVSDWCSDPKHPYYVHVRTTQRIIQLAEQEQIRRETAAAAVQNENVNTNNVDQPNSKATIPRIRFIRVSDLCVVQPAWYFIPIITNIFHSMIFRYQYMADMMMLQSKYIDTMSIRPGDIVDDERDISTTSIQVNANGYVPYPARIGRDDTVDIIVEAALYQPSSSSSKSRYNNKNNNNVRKYEYNAVPQSNHNNIVNDDVDVDMDHTKPFHFTLACRWVGTNMDPYPSQGNMDDGHVNAYESLQSAIRNQQQNERYHNPNNNVRNRNQQQQVQPEKKKKRMIDLPPNRDGSTKRVFPKQLVNISSLSNNHHNNKIQSIPKKPYGICVAIPIYLGISLLISSMIHTIMKVCYYCDSNSYVISWVYRIFIQPIQNMITIFGTILIQLFYPLLQHRNIHVPNLIMNPWNMISKLFRHHRYSQYITF